MTLTGKTNKPYSPSTLLGDDYTAIDTLILPTPTANLEENFSVNCLTYYVNKPAAKLTSEQQDEGITSEQQDEGITSEQ